MKLKFLHRRGTEGKRIRIPFAFKTAAVYTLLFSLILVGVVVGLTSAYTTVAVRSQNLDRLASFVAGRFERPKAPGGLNADTGSRPSGFTDDPETGLDSFAEANRIYVEIKDNDTGVVVSYGEKSINVAGHMDTIRRVNSPSRHLMVRVVSSDSPGPAGLSVGAFIALILLLLLISSVFGGLMIRKMLRPVYDMTRTARSITAKDLSKRIDTVDSHDEFRELAETFNGMLDRIQESYEKQNRFVSDASHELRTPLSVVSGYANLLRRWGSGSPDVLEESVEKIIEETGNMQQLVDRLLFLARADRKTQHVRFERFSVTDMMREVAEETRMIDEEHRLTENMEEGVFLTADYALLKQAMRAIVDNSMKYTPPEGAISISCREQNGLVELEVADTGIGISEKDLPHIFDRFYKADEARTRGKGSSGLGLSIAKWIVERHRGEIRVSSRPGNGTKFTVCLPKLAGPCQGEQKAEP
ncbi:HAMP domain-containing sensor histidine kinase [Caproicibacter fermentans]|uniref:histidine kinase n=1 Tax=Caproicibacter fermentans TaxID=2576756 RepID=A0A7G8T6A9_9FIRM|nr:HAMP domain-containing sensor histidine kinase [Caproicibacter fermentans]QNK39150.1 HAMP domain-containing histidine kinase [Caproicibacter fermentans]